MRDFEFQRHDGDDDGDDAVAERFESAFVHVRQLTRGRSLSRTAAGAACGAVRCSRAADRVQRGTERLAGRAGVVCIRIRG